MACRHMLLSVLLVCSAADYVEDGASTKYAYEPSSSAYGPTLQFTHSIHKPKCAGGCPCVSSDNPCFDPTDCSCRPQKCEIIREFWHGFTKGYYSNLSPDYSKAMSTVVGWGGAITGAYEGEYRRRLQQDYDQDTQTYEDEPDSYVQNNMYPKSRTVCSCPASRHYCDPALARGKSARNWQWWTAGFFAVATCFYFYKAYNNPRNYRWYLYILLAISFISMVSYIFMASYPVGHIRSVTADYGYTDTQEYTQGGSTGYRRLDAGVMFTPNGGLGSGAVERQSFWVQYVQWFLTCPLLLFVIGKFGRQSNGDLYSMIAFMWLTLGLGFLATATPGASRYGYFVFGFVTFFPVLRLIIDGQPATDDEKSTYTKVKFTTVLVWFVYPFIWVLGTGSGVISVSNECICYCLLDLIAKFLVGFWVFLYGSSLPELDADEIPLPFGNPYGSGSSHNPADQHKQGSSWIPFD